LAYCAGCDDNNSLHQKYIDEGETIYTGKVDSVEVFAGNEKVKLTWQINSDPRISRVVISWNNGNDPTVVPVTAGVKTMGTVIDLSEGIYNLRLMTADNEGHSSTEVTRTVQVYGPRYISFLTNRGLNYSLLDNSVTINWTPVESPLIQYVMLTYTDYTDGNPEQKTMRIENDDSHTVLSNIREGDSFSIVTTYLPEGGFETLDALQGDFTIPVIPWYDKLLDKTKFMEVGLPGDNTSRNGNDPSAAVSAWFDDNVESLWHTVWGYVSPDVNPYPMYVSIDFGTKAKLSKFRLWSRPDNRYDNLTFRIFEVWATDELKTGMPDSYWTDGNWKNDWYKLNDYEVRRPSGNTGPVANPTGEDLDAALAGWEFAVPEEAPPCRYVRFIVHTVWSSSYTGMVMAEVTFWGGNDGSF
jgi:hypothetical protein